MTTSPTSFAIVIEWENARFAELKRTRTLLDCLRAQLKALRAKAPIAAEVILLYNEFDIDRHVVETVVAEHFAPAQVPAQVRIVATQGLRYYQQKNHGAALSEADVVIFLDCDLIPEPDWLENMLEAFRRADVDVVAGETYVDHAGWYSKAMALFWFFPLRDPATHIERTHFFHANNVAFRRHVFQRHTFPELPAYRAQCVVLTHRLEQDGIALYVQKSARASHPVPLGLWYFMARALHDGRDRAIIDHERVRRNASTPLRTSYWNYRAYLRDTLARIWGKRREVGLGQPGAIFASAIGIGYGTLRFIGELSGRAAPDALPRLFKI
jgi:glycosyltransferase involved in cell wall biosynthesis